MHLKAYIEFNRFIIIQYVSKPQIMGLYACEICCLLKFIETKHIFLNKIKNLISW